MKRLDFLKTVVCAAACAPILSCAASSAKSGEASAKRGNFLKAADIKIRDPYIFADTKTNTYYMPASDNHKGIKMYKSKDLENWESLGAVFVPDADFWGVGDFWAPDMFELDGKYYIIATFSAREKSVKTSRGIEPLRGCGVLVCDTPDGVYKPLRNAPVTPKDWLCLDGTLFEENGKLYMLYCHEWLQVGDGEIIAQEISRDLTKMIGNPQLLFKASAAKWGKKNPKCMVTDACVVNRAPDGTLYMTWSTFGIDGKYHVGYAKSSNGKLLGDWIQFDNPLNNDDGGHAMIFKTFDGNTKISYHAPNSNSETLTVRDFSCGANGAKIGE